MPAVQNLSGAGYSWGGGTMARIVDTLRPAGKTTPYTIDLALVDAVQLGYGGKVMPVTARPNADRVFNRYETGGHSTMAELLSGAYDALQKPGITLLPDGIKYAVSFTEFIVYLKKSAYDKGEPANGGPLKGIDPTRDSQKIVELSTDPETGNPVAAHHVNIDDQWTKEPNSPDTVIDAAFNYFMKRFAQ
ncbi:hypothetical protein HYW84_00600 [Candidatus Peregrinibacteria bacterium]|nr:hypothetical protein [Candidatus Peregrinibacteria bacterium]